MLFEVGFFKTFSFSFILYFSQDKPRKKSYVNPLQVKKYFKTRANLYYIFLCRQDALLYTWHPHYVKVNQKSVLLLNLKSRSANPFFSTRELCHFFFVIFCLTGGIHHKHHFFSVIKKQISTCFFVSWNSSFVS